MGQTENTMGRDNMTIGTCTWTLGIDNLDALMAKIEEIGLNGVQYCEAADKYSAAEVRQAAQAHGLSLIIYDPFDAKPGTKNGTASEDNAIAYYKKAIDYAAELGCGTTLQGLSFWTENCVSEADAWQRLIHCVRALDTYAKIKGVPLSYEPCNLYEVRYIHNAEEYQKLMDGSGCGDISILLDSFHMNIGEIRPLETLVNYARRLSVFHISGSNREGIAQGNTDFHACYRALKAGGYKGPYVMEFVLRDNPVNTPPRNSAEMDKLCRQLKQSAEIWRSFARYE